MNIRLDKKPCDKVQERVQAKLGENSPSIKQKIKNFVTQIRRKKKELI